MPDGDEALLAPPGPNIALALPNLTNRYQAIRRLCIHAPPFGLSRREETPLLAKEEIIEKPTRRVRKMFPVP